MTSRTTKRALWVVSLVAAVALGLKAWALAAGSSVLGTIVTSVLVPLRDGKRSFSSVQGVHDRLAQRRAEGHALPPSGLKRRMNVEAVERFGYQVYTVSPRENTSPITILYLHGGAWVFDVMDAHWLIIEALAERTGAKVIMPRYPLAPEHSWRESYDFIERLTKETIGSDRSKLIVAGDSAGGALSVGLGQRLLEKGEPLPAGLVLFSPGLDLTFSSPEVAAIEKHDPMLAIPGAREAARLWADGIAVEDPRISPLNGRIAGLPPTAIFTGTRDMLNADARRMARKLNENGVTAELYEYRGMFHVYIAAPIPEARKSLDQAAAFIVRNTSS